MQYVVVFTSSGICAAITNNQEHRGYKWKYTVKQLDEIVSDEKWCKLSDSIYPEINKFTKYQVSDQGRIRGWYNRILKQNYSGGSPTIKLRNDDKTITIKVHRLVLMAFNISNPDNKVEVDHIDSDYKNNKLSNLKWANRKDQGDNVETSTKLSKPVIKRRIKIQVTHGGVTYIHDGINDLAKKLGLCTKTIKRYALNKTEYCGYFFRFIDD